MNKAFSVFTPRILTTSLLLMVCSISSCKKDNPILEPNSMLVGEWKYEYELLSDGSKIFENPYALLEFEYSDGFILNANGTGNSVWFNSINGDFDWTENNFKLTISIPGPDSTTDQFEYTISNLTEQSMEFETPKGHIYFMTKV